MVTDSPPKTPSEQKHRGIKPLIFGIVLMLLALLNILFSVVDNTAIDPFYGFLAVLGAALALYGGWQRA